MPFTSGFDPLQLGDHFTKHRSDFGVSTEEEYQTLADTFLGGPRNADTEECIRARNGDILRYNRVTHEFGILTARGYIRTYYKLNPRVHKMASNLAYFLMECRS